MSKARRSDLVTVFSPRKPETTCPPNVSVRDTPGVVDMAMSQIPTLSVVRDVVVRRIDRPPVCVAFGVIVEELVLVGAIADCAVIDVS